MKQLTICICALNSSYMHTSLSLRYLRQTLTRLLPGANIVMLERTINDQPLRLLQELVATRACLTIFSCYIWNRLLVTKLTRELKQIHPQHRIIWGGPDVAWQAQQLAQEHPEVDCLLAGDIETSLDELFSRHFDARAAAPAQPRVLTAPPARAWQSGYSAAEIRREPTRIYYYESSRGCPFQCSYCLSAAEATVIHKPVAEVLREVAGLLVAEPHQLKWVDRTFNLPAARGRQIWQGLMDLSQKQQVKTRFHFEIAGDWLGEADLQLLSQAPPGLFQLEIGVQSCTPEVLQAINRKSDPARLLENSARLRRDGRVHLHLDLIAGLPLETLDSFLASFDQVMQVRPHQLQLGFLKVLPGTPIDTDKTTFGLIHQPDPPYEILQTPTLSFADLSRLHQFETVFDLLYNSGRMTYALDYLLNQTDSPARLFQALTDDYLQQGHWQQRPALKAVWQWFADFGRRELRRTQSPAAAGLFLGWLKLDYLLSGQRHTPPWFQQVMPEVALKSLQSLPALRTRIRTLTANRVRLEVFPFCLPQSAFAQALTFAVGRIRPDQPGDTRQPAEPTLSVWELGASGQLLAAWPLHQLGEVCRDLPPAPGEP